MSKLNGRSKRFIKKSEPFFQNIKYKRIRMLTADDVMEIATLPIDQGHIVMAQSLGFTSYHVDNDLLHSIFVDFLYDILDFASKRGFPWNSVCYVIEFAYQLLQDVFAKERTLIDAFLMFNQHAKHLQTLTDRQNMLIIDFLSDNIFYHYNLYRHVFCRPREKEIGKFQRKVVVPEIPLPLSQSKLDNPKYRFDVEMAKFDKIAMEAKKRHQNESRERRLKLPPIKAAIRESIPDGPVNRKIVEAAVAKIIDTMMNAQKEDFEESVKFMEKSLDFQLEKGMVAIPPGASRLPVLDADSMRSSERKTKKPCILALKVKEWP